MSLNLKGLFNSRASEAKRFAGSDYEETAAHRAWDFQVERAHNGLLFWRSATLLSLALLTICFFFTIAHISKPKMIPYVVEIGADGSARFKGLLESQKITLNDAHIRHSLTNFISKARIVSVDPVATKRNLRDIYFFATEAAQKVISAYAKENLDLSEKRNVHRDVVFELFEPIGQNAWRAQWREDTRVEGALTQQQRFSGVFNFMQEPPAAQAAAEINPLGFYITAFNFQEIRQ